MKLSVSGKMGSTVVLAPGGSGCPPASSTICQPRGWHGLRCAGTILACRLSLGWGDVRCGRAGWRRMGVWGPSPNLVLELMSPPLQRPEGSAAGSPSMPS